MKKTSTVLVSAFDSRTQGPVIKRLPLTTELCEKIAKENGYLNAQEVAVELKRGQPIYTSFKRYTLERTK